MNPNITTFLQSIHPLLNNILQEVASNFQHQEYTKNHLLLKQGRPCKYLWFMVKGAVRFFYTDQEGRESNVWFSLDQDIVADAPSFVSQHPSNESIQLLEESEFYAIEYSQLQTLLQNTIPLRFGTSNWWRNTMCLK